MAMRLHCQAVTMRRHSASAMSIRNQSEPRGGYIKSHHPPDDSLTEQRSIDGLAKLSLVGQS